MVVGAIARDVHAGGLRLHLAVAGRDKIALVVRIDRALNGAVFGTWPMATKTPLTGSTLRRRS
jgi:hypothetical protein